MQLPSTGFLAEPSSSPLLLPVLHRYAEAPTTTTPTITSTCIARKRRTDTEPTLTKREMGRLPSLLTTRNSWHVNAPYRTNDVVALQHGVRKLTR